MRAKSSPAGTVVRHSSPRASCSASPTISLPTKFGGYLSVRLRNLAGMRSRTEIDAELRLLAAVRRSIREQGSAPSSRQVDELLDERSPEVRYANG